MQNHLYSGVGGVGGLVHALAHQRVVHVGHRDDLRRNRDAVPGQAVWVAAAVPTLVMPTADFIRGAHQCFAAVYAQFVQHIRADDRVGLHDVELLLRQAAGLVQNLVVYRDFADVVQRRCQHDQLLLLGRQVVLVGFLGQALQQALGQRADVLHVQAALAVAELNDLAQNRDHHLGVLLFLAGLARHQRDEPPLLGVELDGVKDAPVDDARVKGAADIVRDAHLVGVTHDRVGVLAGNHDDRDILNPVVAVHGSQHFKAVHHRHDDVQQNQRNAGAVLLQHGQAFRAVGGLQYIVVAAQNLRQNRAVHLGIINDQDVLAGLVLAPGGGAGPGGGGVLGHDRVFVVLGLVHQLVGAANGVLHRFVRLGHHAADADRKLQTAVPRHGGGVDFLADTL